LIDPKFLPVATPDQMALIIEDEMHFDPKD
jgi:hypothetical protein